MSALLLSLLLFTAVTTITPGGATTLATASGLQFGFRRSIPLIAGIVVGLASLAAAAGGGLAALIAAAPALRLAMRLVGTVYLLWLAWKVGHGGPPVLDGKRSTKPMGFLTGLLLLLLNPKAWATTLSAAASYSGLAASPVRLAAVVGAVFGISAVASLSLWCLGGSALARRLRTDRQWRVLNLVLGVLLALSTVPIWL
ncbi:LysE family transporter [Mesorhizobium sp. BAC0120]|uniref:LysE family translocator n=1 Tax=Mesorhizobium sp. BAC0120 TaxID=3090670 RepID=UPI00298D1A17|nr:LysE family transporter [Mesorhizobium sp. BAC0120]MDW6022518.1 LysE family transporter [Mesorhizobium sp. BAC0120]